MKPQNLIKKNLIVKKYLQNESTICINIIEHIRFRFYRFQAQPVLFSYH